MFRKQLRIVAFLLLAALLAGCGAQTEQEAKILLKNTETISSNLKTAQAEISPLQRESSTSASVAFAKKTTVRLQADDALFVEHMVSVGQEVKKGDVISVFRKQNDNIRLTEIAYALEELENSRQDGLEDRAEQMEALAERMEPYSPDSYGYNDVRSEQQLYVLNLEMEKLQLEQEQFLLRLQEQERQLKQEREKLLEAEKELTLVSPVDGFVESLEYMTPGKVCYRGQNIAVIHDPTQLMLVADSGIYGNLKMGQQVYLQYGRYDTVVSLPGIVVAADNALPSDLRTGKAYIVLDGELDPALAEGVQIMSALRVSTSVKVSSLGVDLQNVLVVPRDAVQFEGSKPYVEVVDGTSTFMRYVQVGPNDKDNSMILTGLEEGTVVIVK